MYIYSGTTIVFLSNQYWLNSCFWQLKLKRRYDYGLQKWHLRIFLKALWKSLLKYA